MKKLLAFTLAEVLITMTIVGVVASLTIPTLQYQRQKKEYSAKIKNFYSRMSNAVNDMVIDKGIQIEDIQKPGSGNGEVSEWYEEWIDPYMGHKAKLPAANGNYYYYFNDGSRLYMESPSSDGTGFNLYYDVTGKTDFIGKTEDSPLGKKVFVFRISTNDASRLAYFNNKKTLFGPFGNGLYSVSRDKLKTSCQNYPIYCTRLLEYDNWEFKKDYPHKL